MQCDAPCDSAAAAAIPWLMNGRGRTEARVLEGHRMFAAIRSTISTP
jgi:hypothetical protein